MPTTGPASTTQAARDPLTWPARAKGAKPWTRWWWLGSAVDRAGLTRELERFAAAGLGGVEICPIYGAQGAEDRFVKFLSPEWMALLIHTTAEAERLGLGVDLTTGTGWPFGGPQVDADAASCKLVLDRQTVAGGAALDVPLKKGTFVHAVAVDAKGASVDLRERVADGHVRWTAPAGSGDWQVVVAVRQSPIQKVKRAAPGGEGNVVDPYSTAALERYLKPFDDAFARAGGGRAPDGHFHDSFEYYGADWTPDFLAQFERRRGYDLRPHLATLAGVGAEEQVARVRCDYRQTIGELHLDFVVRWVEWCHAKGGIAREQAHGAPANLIDVYAAADVPETEMFGPADEEVVPMNRLASSAAHLAGRELATSESFTWLGEHFNVTLDEAKREADLLFLAGINRLFFHGIAYSPDDVAWPGWLFYASTHFGPAGGLWRDLPSFTGYLARCQAALQSGRPSRDVLLYLPVFDVWQRTAGKGRMMQFGMHDAYLSSHPYHATAMALWKGGYLYDAVSDHFLSTARAVDGRVEINGMRYATVVVPACRVMPVETLRRLRELASAGATVVFVGALPDDVPGLQEVEARRAELRSLAGEAKALSGRVFVGEKLDALLADARVPREPMADAGLLCERRAHGDGHTYFIVDRAKTAFDGWTALGAPAASASLLDPRFERRAGAAAVRQREGRAEVYLQLEPGESVVVQTFAGQHTIGERWTYATAAGDARAIDGRWHVEFIDGGPALPAAFETDRLASWTDRDDAEAKRFAGTARYRVEFDHASGEADAWQLDLGRVCESARVRLNDKEIGTAWAAPFRLPVGDALKAGRNVLEVEVTNLAANRIADLDRRKVEWKRFHEINFVNKDYKPFDASTWPLRESGLIGPVRLVPMKAFEPK